MGSTKTAKMSSSVSADGGQSAPQATYKPKCIMVTGGAGFIASHVVILLAQKYPDVMIINYDKLDKVASLKNLESIDRLRNYKFVKGDILSAELLNYVIKEEGVDTIMHFAAESHVDNSFGNSFVFTSTNVMGTHTMMEVAKTNKDQIRRFIHVSTDEFMENRTSKTQRAKSPLYWNRPTRTLPPRLEQSCWRSHTCAALACHSLSLVVIMCTVHISILRR